MCGEACGEARGERRALHELALGKHQPEFARLPLLVVHFADEAPPHLLASLLEVAAAQLCAHTAKRAEGG